MKKSTAIRETVSKHAGLTNKEIREYVHRTYGLHCLDSQIIAVVGPFHERSESGFPPHLVRKAREFLSACGGQFRKAKLILETVS